jgi:uncharacterized protein YjiS (DUF1127 family)
MDRAGGYGMAYTGFQPGFAGAGVALWAKALEQAALLILKLVSAHAESRRRKATLDELRCMGERDLKDIGLTLADVQGMTGALPDRFQHMRDWR